MWTAAEFIQTLRRLKIRILGGIKFTSPRYGQTSSQCENKIQPSYSAFFACSLSLGAVPSFVICSFSMSAAHNAAPTVLVKAKKMDANGTSSSKTAATPNLLSSQSHAQLLLLEVPYPV